MENATRLPQKKLKSVQNLLGLTHFLTASRGCLLLPYGLLIKGSGIRVPAGAPIEKGHRKGVLFSLVALCDEKTVTIGEEIAKSLAYVEGLRNIAPSSRRARQPIPSLSANASAVQKAISFGKTRQSAVI